MLQILVGVIISMVSIFLKILLLVINDRNVILTKEWAKNDIENDSFDMAININDRDVIYLTKKIKKIFQVH